MLDSETKKRIDDIRDILAGKTPGPESQVEQITTALIYKFMHDMDEESVEMGGKRSFFVGEYKKYAWKNLFDPKLEGADRVSLYREAIEKMEFNPGAPELFRQIFKNADLPFREPRTLNMFLKVINEFDYSHSEKLGDAFEYLLSFTGSQGNAGQFRTPRHIIDFIVEIVNPQKNESILDPACGTAGFLISSFKHIQKQNTSKKSNGRLTAADRKQIGKNLVGYDISPDMTRLSLVNMYLHDFATPKIYEYDTLSSEDRWNEYYDVILANPPFFSPKGGIQPHSRFGVQSKRAEVLFVDYIMEHLNPKGRAGIIVPEGIIFQTGRAYKTLRKKLIEDCLVGVISLPGGVFNPYSGVKTSILILDKELCKKSDNIFFAKVENDGFSLGAQRNPIDKNDLSEVISIFSRKEHFSADEKDAFLVAKQDILNSFDVGLSFSRYQNNHQNLSEFELKKIDELCLVLNGSTPNRKERTYWDNGTIPWFTIDDLREQGYVIKDTKQKVSQKALDKTSIKLLPPKTTLLCCTASVGACAFTEIPLTTNQQFNGLIIKKEYKELLLPKYLFWISTNLKKELIRHSGKTSFNFISVTKVKEIKIPLPPIEIQQEIVKELDGYQKVIDGCRQVVENYKPAIDIDPSWEMVELRDVVTSKPVYGSGAKKMSFDGKVRYIRITDISEDGRLREGEHVSPSRIEKEYFLNENDFLIARSASVGRSYLHLANDIKCQFAGYLIKFPLNRKKIVPQYLFYLTKLDGYLSWIDQHKKQGTISNINAREYLSFSFPLPPIEIQQQIVEELEREQKMLDSSKQLIEIYTQKIQDRISKVWGE